ncbi:YbaB/EbfC family nucleoid-associated protein [Jiella sp. MQZ9-1]|uniref:Nucleoid-associated protein J1C48_07265 n=1 Tax=Jiella flava TaxID=2816857 RepID=A0A939FVP2_9HYPH|nr:YbaB/EbfC family nucleoid-associated protein [Jiella flava]MBO0662367.1 YbaB/EbfC family nucleoid-associated protein [Jiella flava]MCD2470802.1 YbaB/EbfC family nucleoid-associated protein [Jiella flava]
MKDLMNMMKQAKAMQEKMAGFQEEMKTVEASGQSGGGLVTVTLRGTGEMAGLTIDPSLIKDDEKDILEDLIVAAHADAHTKLQLAIQEKTQEMTAGLNLPAGMKLPF